MADHVRSVQDNIPTPYDEDIQRKVESGQKVGILVAFEGLTGLLVADTL